MAAGMPKIKVQFVIDADGIMRIKAMEERSGTETEIQIKSQYGISEEEMGKMLMDSIKNAEQDMKTKGIVDAKNEGSALMLSAKKFIKQNEEILSQEEVTQLQEFMKVLDTEINAENKDAIHSAIDKLNTYSAPLAERAMDFNINKALKGKDLSE